MNVMSQLFNLFEDKGIRYVHFKSNCNLNESFNGKADFDVLVDKKKLLDTEIILSSIKGKRFNPVRYGRYPGVDNWIIFDEESGILYHLHLHYQIASGKALIKDYIIPWEEIIFETRIKDLENDIYITNPNLEILLLTVRSVIKSHMSDRIKASFGLYQMHSSLLYEKKYLLSLIDADIVNKNIQQIFPERYADIISKCSLKDKISGREFIKLSKAVRKSLKEYRRLSPFKSNVSAFQERIGDIKNKVLARKFDKNIITKKTSLHGGAIIAFVGSDGAGKSTVTTEIQRWLSKKIECKRFYMGTGDGKTTLFGKIIKGVGTKVQSSEKSESVSKSNVKKLSLFKHPKKYLRKRFKMSLISDVEKNNFKKIISMNQYRINGGISVLDRYPQIEIPGQNDGPKIGQYIPYFGETRTIKRLKRKEAEYLSIVKKIKPDVVFRLNISADTALERKDDLKKDDPIAIANFRKKVEDVRKIKFQGARIIDIDAEQPFEQELLQIKRIIWNEII